MPHAPARSADTVKVRLQTMGGTFRSPLETAARMVSTEGPLSLWKGAAAAFASAGIENGVGFAINGLLRRAAMRVAHVGDADAPHAPPSLASEFVIGALGGVVTATAICPAEVIKCRVQVDTHAQRRGGGVPSSTAVASSIWRGEGVAGFYRGLPALWCRDVPFNCLFFGGYRAYLSLLHASSPALFDPHAPASSLVAGGLAGMTAWAVVFPADVVKSRHQVAATTTPAVGSSSSSSSSSGPPEGIRATFAEIGAILRTGGLRALYKGSAPAILRGFPANAALFYGVSVADRFLASAGV